MKWTAHYSPIRKFEKDMFNFVIPVKLSDFKEGSCSICHNAKIDHCYNCEQAICSDHCNLFLFNEFPLIVFGVCPDCVRDNNLGVLK